MMCEHEFMSPPLGHYRDSCGNFKLITKPICVNCRKTEDEIVLENKLAENINLLRDEKNSRERLMRQNESLARQYVAEKQQLAAAKAELVAEREKWETQPAYYWQQRCYQQSDSFQKDYACLKKVCQHEKKMREQAEAQNKRMREALEKIACDACNDCGNCQRDMEIARLALEISYGK